MDLLLYSDVYPLKADVLKAAHHGSNTSSVFEFIEAVSPEYALISCDSNEDSSYPHVDTALTLVDCGVEMIRTTEVHGNISVLIDLLGRMDVYSDYSLWKNERRQTLSFMARKGRPVTLNEYMIFKLDEKRKRLMRLTNERRNMMIFTYRGVQKFGSGRIHTRGVAYAKQHVSPRVQHHEEES